MLLKKHIRLAEEGSLAHRWYLLAFAACLLPFWVANAADPSVPASADVGRINPFEAPLIRSPDKALLDIPTASADADIPDGADEVSFTLNSVRIDGATIFGPDDLKSLYASQLGETFRLGDIWRLAAAITQRYRAEGHFLSRAFVPAQSVKGGDIEIRVIEGYISDVTIEGAAAPSFIADAYAQKLMAQRPITADALESFMLRLEDLPGVSYRALIRPSREVNGAAQLVLQPQQAQARTLIDFNNNGSRFIGPYQGSISHTRSLAAHHETTFSSFASLPADELTFFSLRHHVAIAPELNLQLNASRANSQPGGALAVNEIKSQSVELGMTLNWQPIRQRTENASLSLGFDSQNTHSDVLGGLPLTRDKTRSLRLSGAYDVAARWNGYHYFNGTLSHGLGLLGASNAGDAALSRAQGKPDYTSLNASYARLQPLPYDIMMVAQAAGQWASGPLLSAEEFGYGGQSFGRAYDNSEITGDHGVAALIELRYSRLEVVPGWSIVPYGFYDIGRVWTEDTGGEDQSASSAGFGARFAHEAGLTANLGLAFPLSKPIDNPIYGNSKNPRLMLAIGLGF
jgi:hemolysin activation/secretion protein